MLFSSFVWLGMENTINPPTSWNSLELVDLRQSMAWNVAPSSSLRSSPPWIQVPERLLPARNHTFLLKLTSLEKFSSTCKSLQAEGVTEEQPALEEGSSARTQLNLLEQLTSPNSTDTGYEIGSDSRRPTIREQLSEIVGGDRSEGDFSLPLGKKLKASLNTLTISQRRNIKRQAYLDEVSKRNDSVFYATIGAFVILPPVVILSIAILTGYVQLFP